MTARLSEATRDLRSALAQSWLWTRLGWNDVRLRFAGSWLGSLWITLNLALMVTALTLVFATPLGSHWSRYAPFVAIGLVLWQFIQTTLNEAGAVFVSAAETIRNAPMPLSVHVLRLLWRNLLVLAHNAVVIAVVLVIFGLMPSAPPTVVAGLVLVSLTLFWTSFIIGLVGSRFRDVGQMVGSALQLLFFITPIFWPPAALGPGREWIVAINPVFALIDIVRAPLLGVAPMATSWPVAALAAALATVVGFVALAQLRSRVSYWI